MKKRAEIRTINRHGLGILDDHHKGPVRSIDQQPLVELADKRNSGSGGMAKEASLDIIQVDPSRRHVHRVLDDKFEHGFRHRNPMGWGSGSRGDQGKYRLIISGLLHQISVWA